MNKHHPHHRSSSKNARKRSLSVWASLTVVLLLLVSASNRSVSALDPKKLLTQYSHNVWQIEDGLPQNSVTAIAQTQDGYLWFGTEEGLVRFDGVHFTVFNKRNTEQFLNHVITALSVSRDGSLWIGTSAGLLRYQGGQFTRYSSQDGLASDTVIRIYESREGVLWVGTAGRAINQLKGGKFTAYQVPGLLPDNKVTSIAQDQQGEIWLGTNGSPVYRFKDGKFTGLPTQEGLSTAAARCLYTGSDGSLWIGTTNRGLTRYQDGKLTVYHASDGLPSETIFSITEDRDKTIWVGTNNGLARLRGEKFETQTLAESLARSISALYEDREGSLWIGTLESGLNRFKDGKFTNYTVKEGFPSNYLKAIYESRDGSLWFGDNGHGLGRLKEGKLTTYKTEDGLASNNVSSIYEGREGKLWVGFSDGGVAYFKDGRFTTANINSGPWSQRVRTLYESSDGSLWMGSSGAGMYQLKDGESTRFDLPEGLSHGVVSAITETRDGSIWIGTLGGLDRLQHGRITAAYTSKNGLSHSYVTSLYEDQDGTLWVGTYGGGVNKFKEGKFTAYTIKQGLPDDVAFQIIEDSQSNLWITCNTGIFRVSKKDLADFDQGKIKSIPSVSYGTADGMPTSECIGGQYAALRTRDGKIWFSTIKGLTAIDPARIKNNELPPPVVIEQLLVNQLPVATNQQLQLEPGARELEIHYTGLSFLAPEKVKFKYKLEGFDKVWVEAGKRRVAYYTNLPPGQYQFRVMACNNDGVWNEAGASFAFYLKPHFYQTTWFYALCVLAVALAGFGIYRLRVRQLRRRTQQLEQIVEERTQELKHSQARVLKLEKQATEQRMAGGFAHEMRNALAGSKLVLDQALAIDDPEPQTSLTLANCRNLKEIYLGVKGRLENDDLQVVLGKMQTIFANEERLHEIMQLVRKATSRGLNITQQIMEYSEVSQQRPGHQRVNFDELIFKVINEVKEEFSSHGVSIQYEADQQSECVTGDEAHFYAVIKNLLLNAQDALIDPSLAERTERWIQITATSQDGHCLITITDNGVGIAPENMQKIFEPFYSTKPASGTGLGLGMVKKILSIYQGEIEVSSRLGLGTRVVIRVPERQPEEVCVAA